MAWLGWRREQLSLECSYARDLYAISLWACVNDYPRSSRFIPEAVAQFFDLGIGAFTLGLPAGLSHEIHHFLPATENLFFS